MSGPLSMVVKAAVIFAVLGVVVYDISAILMTRYGAGEIAQAVADAAATTWRSSGRDQDVTVQTAMKVAEQKGAKLIGFTVKEKDILVEIKVDPRRTVVAHYISQIDQYGNGEAVASSYIEW
ncbi:MAG: hypothetical protein M1548_04750 [Actinobacteria bacterium]|nr:hypothetical protein [Actinomycetota bacterium]